MTVNGVVGTSAAAQRIAKVVHGQKQEPRNRMRLMVDTATIDLLYKRIATHTIVLVCYNLFLSPNIVIIIDLMN